MDNMLQKIKDASIKEPKNLEQVCLKLSEETGEVAQALLADSGVSGCGYKNLNMDDVKEECADVILAALSLFYKCQGTDEELRNILNIKLTKWISKMD